MTKTVAKRGEGQLVDLTHVPAQLSEIIDLEDWAQAIVNKVPYEEPDPDFIPRMLAIQTITAETIEDVFAQAEIKGLQKILPDTPGATTGPIMITDLYVAASDFETGNPSYVILTYTDMETGEDIKCTTGATNVQATLLALLARGMWPIKCQIKRGDNKDKGGRHLMFVLPPD